MKQKSIKSKPVNNLKKKQTNSSGVKHKSKFKKSRKLPKSSSSNPETKKFREAAKQSASGFLLKTGRSTSVSNGPSPFKAGLTLQDLEKHNKQFGGFQESDLQDDSASIGKTTFNTWATNMTGCTNVTFSKVHRYINSSSAVQKEILAVLAAVTDVIKEKGGEGKDLQYFGILVMSLETADKPETQMAMAHLLSIVIKKVPVNVLQSRFSQVCKALTGTVTSCINKDSLAPLKSTLLCLASLLRVQQLVAWTESSTQNAYQALLAFSCHKKPKIRKVSQRCINVVLKGSLLMQENPAPPFHPAAPITAQYCLKKIQAGSGDANKHELLYTLSILKDVLSLFPPNSVKSICETLLKLMTLADTIIRTSCMEIFYKLFSFSPSQQAMPPNTNAQFISAFYEYKPSEKDSQPMTAWLKVMEAAVISLSVDQELCLNHLPKLCSTCMTCLLADKEDVAKAAVSVFQNVLEKCIPCHKDTSDSKKNQYLVPLKKIVTTLEAGLSYQFFSAWQHVFQLWSTAFKVMGKIVPDLFTKGLISMGELRDAPHFSFKSDLEQAVGQAVKALGPQTVLESIPLNITGQNDNLEFPKGWLLPVIRDNVSHTRLGFFTSYFLPLSVKCKKRSEESDSIAESKAYEAIFFQIWSMLKGFFDHPVDIKQNFQGIAKVLGTTLSEKDELRLDILSALRSVIKSCLDDDEDVKQVARFSKNFLPILFNLFTTENEVAEGTRLAVLETIKKYLTITDLELIGSFAEKCLVKLEEQTESDQFKNIALMDLMIAMIAYCDTELLQRLLLFSINRLESNNKTEQKKSYRILEEICSGDTENKQNLLSKKFKSVHKALIKSLSTSNPSSKAPRLRCLIYLLKSIKTDNLSFINATLPEAILCTKAVGNKARTAAFDLVIFLSERFIDWSKTTQTESLDTFVNQVLAGLAGSPHMISATLLALTRIVFHYKDQLPGRTLDNLIESVCLLLNSKTREITKTALGFIKVVLSAFENTVFSPHLKDLIDGIHDVALKGNMRRLTKAIYTKLIKKFGFELILKMSKVDLHKFLKNLHKVNERSKKKVTGEKQDEDESDEHESTRNPDSIEDLLRDTDSEEDKEDSRPKRREKKSSRDTWLMETEDDIVDFNDPAAAKQISASRPAEKVAVKEQDNKERGFKLAPDGKLIITDNQDDVGQVNSEDEDNLDELLTALEGGQQRKSRKRKRTFVDDDDDVDSKSKPSDTKYKAGGSGIHRDLSQAKPEFGAEFRSKKGKGDITKKGKHDPYAYVPLNIAQLNKRKQMKLKGQFNSLVRGVKKGAAKGKSKSLKKRTKK